MKRIVRNLVIGGWMFAVAAVPTGFAQEIEPYSPDEDLVNALIEEEMVSVGDLEIDNPGILSTNPFYFIKKLRRSTWRVFRLSPLAKAEYELNILNEKAAELIQLNDVWPDNNRAMLKAADLYEESAKSLAHEVGDLEGMEGDEFNEFVLKLIDKGSKHLRVFDELKSSSDDAHFYGQLGELQNILSGILADIAVISGPENFKSKFLSVVKNNRDSLLRELKAAEIMDRIREKLPVNFAQRQMAAEAKETLILKEEVKIQAEATRMMLPALLERLPGDLWRRVKILDEARVYFVSSELKNDFTLVRQLLLDLAGQSRLIGKPEVEQVIADLERVLELLEEGGFSAPAVEFNLAGAKESFENGQYEQAFGQASTAAADLEDALIMSSFSQNENKLAEELGELKELYDRLAGEAGENEELFAEAEKALVKLADRTNKKPSVIVPELREVKVLLYGLEQL